MARSSPSAPRATVRRRTRSGKPDRSGRRSQHCDFLPAQFVFAGRFGQPASTTRTGQARPDAVFCLPGKGQASRVGARELEWLMTAVSQHVFFVRVRAAIEPRGRTMRWLANRLPEVAFPGAGSLLGDTVRKASYGDRWLDPRDRAIIESLVGSLVLPASRRPAARSAAVGRGNAPEPAARRTGAAPAARTSVTPPGQVQLFGDGADGLPIAPRVGARTGETVVEVDARALEGVVAAYPAMEVLLGGAGRAKVSFRADRRGRRVLRGEARDLATTSARTAMNTMRHAATERYVSFDLLAPDELVARAAVEVEDEAASADEPYGMVQGYIGFDDVWVNLRLPDAWWDQVGGPGWSLLDRRFVMSVAAIADGRPALVRALALVTDPELGPTGGPRPSEAEQFCEAEVGTYQFRVAWSRAGRARLVPQPDPELDSGMRLTL